MAKKKSSNRILRDYGIAIGGAILVAFFIRFFFMEAYRMPSRAMTPAVEAGDTLFVSKMAYGVRVFGSDKKLFASPAQYGDVVVFEFPDEPGREYIKRVVGLPGDTVVFRNGRLILNDNFTTHIDTLDDFCGMERLPSGKSYSVCWETPFVNFAEPVKVGEGEIFVIGDLRTEPPESRRLKAYGKLPLSSVKGKATLIWLSILPPGSETGGDWFSRIRFDRMFKRIE